MIRTESKTWLKIRLRAPISRIYSSMLKVCIPQKLVMAPFDFAVAESRMIQNPDHIQALHSPVTKKSQLSQLCDALFVKSAGLLAGSVSRSRLFRCVFSLAMFPSSGKLLPIGLFLRRQVPIKAQGILWPARKAGRFRGRCRGPPAVSPCCSDPP